MGEDQRPAIDVPAARSADVRLEFHWDFHDGPRTGALQWNGLRLWFQEAGGQEFVYDLLDLPPDQWTHIDHVQDLFRQYVGTHTDHGDDGRRDLSGVNPNQDEWRLFYDDPQVKAVFTPSGPVVGRWAPPD